MSEFIGGLCVLLACGSIILIAVTFAAATLVVIKFYILLFDVVAEWIRSKRARREEK